MVNPKRLHLDKREVLLKGTQNPIKVPNGPDFGGY